MTQMPVEPGPPGYVPFDPEAGAAAAAPVAANVYGLSPELSATPVLVDGPGTMTNARAAERGDASQTRMPASVHLGKVVQGLASLSIEARKLLQRQLIAAGNLPDNYRVGGSLDDAFIKAFAALLEESSRNNFKMEGPDGSAVENVQTWRDYLAQKIRETETDPSKGENGVEKRIKTLNLETDGEAFRTAFREALGRAPSEGEIEAFIDRYNAAAAEKPLVTTVETLEDGTVMESTSGGLDPAKAAREEIQDNPDYANYQAVSYFMPALERALGAVGGVGD